MTLLDDLRAILGDAHLLTGAEAAPWARDWTGAWTGEPLAVLRPGTTAEVAACLRLAHDARAPVVPAGGRTGLTGATRATQALVLSLDRMRAVRALKPGARLAVAEAGVVLDQLNDAAGAHGLRLALTFGARGSATVGGVLSTNAGGSNVLAFGSAREQCLGLEVVLADGRVLDLLSELHKDNAGYALRHLFVGAEGTLGVVTAAVLRLTPRPAATATAMLAVPSVSGALALLARLREEVGPVEAFEYMPRSYIRRDLAARAGAREPFDRPQDHAILVEVASLSPRDAEPGPDGATPLQARLDVLLADALDRGDLLDAVPAQNEAQRRAMWERREAAAEIARARKPSVDTDVALPLDRVGEFLLAARAAQARLDPEADEFVVAHLGDGNVHWTGFPTRADPDHLEAIRSAVDAVAVSLGGTFSAEHGIGLLKRPSMARHKDPVALDVMRAVKRALDPQGILNPGKVLPD